MKKTQMIIMAAIFLLKIEVVVAQIQFEPIFPTLPAPQNIADFVGVAGGAVAFADIDGDNDQDVLITGVGTAKLYTNDGMGNYTLVSGTPFEGVYFSSMAFTDIDNDNDQDVLIVGRIGSLGNTMKIATLFTNDGLGNFTLVTDTPFVGVVYGAIAFADVDGDNDPDVLITGDTGEEKIAKLYLNDGLGNFNLVFDTPFIGIKYSAIAFADVDGDDSQDVLISGWSDSGRISKLYSNDGTGNFMLVPETPFVEVSNSSLDFADIDGDGDQDVLITGKNASYQGTSELYINDGNGIFSLVSETSFDQVYSGSVEFEDVDNDNDLDVLISGHLSVGNRVSKLFLNDGLGNFSLVLEVPFFGAGNSSVEFADVDGDNDRDVLITGRSDAYQNMSKLYNNDGLGNFALVTGSAFEGVENGSIAFADIDGDNDQDVIIMGIAGGDVTVFSVANLYVNDGVGNFFLVENTPFDSVLFGDVAFSDVDGDNDQDVLITGKNSSNQRIAKLYVNDGSGNFNLDSGTPFEGVSSSSIAFSDVDGDNDQDVLITGNTGSSLMSELYINDGLGGFSLMFENPFVEVEKGAVTFADIDGDGDQDVLITGSNFIQVGEGEFETYRQSLLYNNDGNGNFTPMENTPFDGVNNGDVAFADIDGDNDKDVLITGYNNFSQRISTCYTNDGLGNFTLLLDTPFEGVSNSSIAFADVDGDNDQDVLITGRTMENQRISNLYSNDGVGNFTLVSETPFVEVHSSSVAFVDVDGDDNQDVLITGSANFGKIARAYKNISPVTIDNVVKVDEIKLYPNPSAGSFWIDFGSLEFVSVRIYDTQGKIIYEENIQITDVFQFNLNLEHGIYLVEIISQDKSHMLKFLME